MLPADRELFLARGAGDDARAERLADLDRGKADAAGGAEHEQRLAGAQRAAVAQRMVRSPVGEEERRPGDEIHALRQRQQPRGLGLHLFGEGAVGGEGDDLVARLEAADSVADFLHHAGELAAGRKGQRRLELVLVLDDQHVRES